MMLEASLPNRHAGQFTFCQIKQELGGIPVLSACSNTNYGAHSSENKRGGEKSYKPGRLFVSVTVDFLWFAITGIGLLI